MIPAVEAAKVYEQERCARTFEDDLFLHLQYGFVFSTPTAFIMGRPVRHDANAAEIKDPTIQFTDPDGWWVYLAAGESIPLFFEHEPYALPWIGWERKNKPRWYRREGVMKNAFHISI
jgi:hypothetical protein